MKTTASKVIKAKPNWMHVVLCGIGLALTACSTGCQVVEGGQTLPSGWYLTDDVQYYPPGTEFKLSREAQAMKEYKANQELLNP